MLLLTGEFDLTLDDKHRLAVPAKVRDQIDPEEHGSGFYVVLGANRILCFYPDEYYKRIALVVAPRMVAPDESLALDRVHYSLAGRVELDRQGRLLLGDRALKRGGIKERVTLIGVRDHLELWDQDLWEKYLDQHLGAHEQMMLQAREQVLKMEGQTAQPEMGLTDHSDANPFADE